MKRDMDLIRRIVMTVRDLPVTEYLDGLEGVDQSLYAEHANLLIQAGLAEGVFDQFLSGGSTCAITRLTWAGHDFADAVADETIWNKAKENVIRPAASWSFGILTEYLKYEIKARLGLPQI